MKKIINNIPNILSLFNLWGGCLAAVALWEGQHTWMFIWMGLSLGADLLDGAAARLLDARSEIGKQLDSLADMVSFGFFPGLALFLLLKEVTAETILPYLGFMIPVFSAIRLARFNLDDQQEYAFTGLPTPANAIWVLGLLWYVFFEENLLSQWMTTPLFLVGVIFLSCFLLVANIPMFSLKFRHFRWSGNEIKFIFVLSSLVLFALFRGESIYWIIWVYVCLSLLNYFLKLIDL